jgi:hypothetical protein
MFNRLRLSHRRLQLSCIVIVLLALTLLGGYLQKASTTSPVEAAMTRLTTHQVAGHIIVQLFQVPGFIYPSISGVPEWTLYEDGLLVFKDSNSLDLLQAHLSPGNVRTILNVIVRQDSFFASTKDAYGRPIPDAGSLLLSVVANGQQKQVRLYGEPTTPADKQTQHVFAIKNFLLNYRPAATQPYTPPGVALVVTPQNGDSTGVSTWPYKDISLARTAAQECPLLSPDSNTCPSVSGSKTGILAILGSRGLALLHPIQGVSYSRVKEQGKIYRLVIWPLLPDALSPHQSGSPAIQVQGVSSGTWPLLLRG